jgi:LPXTG-motif cell wall-anchored protein
MGKWGYLVNIWACCWTAFVSVIFLFPTIRPVTGDNMNYAIVFLAAILVASTLYWYIRGRRFYTGPLIEAQILQDDESGDAILEKKMDNNDSGRNYDDTKV